MLENSIWKQYNAQNNFREMIAKYSKLEPLNLIEDDKNLYGILKTKLTRKELKLFAMDSSSAVGDEDIKEVFSFDDEELKQARFKLYKKLKQDKVRLEFLAKNSDDLVD